MLEEKILDVTIYDLFRDVLFYEKGGSLIVNRDILLPDLATFLPFTNNFFVNNFSGDLFRFDFEDFSLEKVLIEIDEITKTHFIEESEDKFNYYNEYLDLEYTLSYLCPFFYNNIAVAQFENDYLYITKLAGVSIDDDSIIWEYDLSKELPNASYDEDEEDYVDRLIGILGGKLWVLTNAGRLVVLDVETGKVLKVFSAGDEDAENGFEVMFVDFYKKDGDEDYLYGIGNEFFYKLDVHQIKIVEEYCFIDDDLKEFKNIFYPKLQGDYFTFFAETSDVKFRYAGVYDYINRKTVWIKEIISEEESKKGNGLIGPEPLRVHGDKLYIKDEQQNLHIFEWDKK